MFDTRFLSTDKNEPSNMNKSQSLKNIKNILLEKSDSIWHISILTLMS